MWNRLLYIDMKSVVAVAYIYESHPSLFENKNHKARQLPN